MRHLGVARVHGRFTVFDGTIRTGETIERSSVTARIETDSIDTGYSARDGYIRGDDVLAADRHKELAFRSTRIRPHEDRFLIDAELTLRGVSKELTLVAELGGFGTDPVRGVPVLGVSASVTVSRTDFGLAPHVPPPWWARRCGSPWTSRPRSTPPEAGPGHEPPSARVTNGQRAQGSTAG